LLTHINNYSHLATDEIDASSSTQPPTDLENTTEKAPYSRRAPTPYEDPKKRSKAGKARALNIRTRAEREREAIQQQINYETIMTNKRKREEEAELAKNKKVRDASSRLLRNAASKKRTIQNHWAEKDTQQESSPRETNPSCPRAATSSSIYSSSNSGAKNQQKKINQAENGKRKTISETEEHDEAQGQQQQSNQIDEKQSSGYIPKTTEEDKDQDQDHLTPRKRQRSEETERKAITGHIT
jgi:hypothetical protein